MINEKDRGQLLRMAGNIACGLVTNGVSINVAELSAKLALASMQEVDKLIADQNAKEVR